MSNTHISLIVGAPDFTTPKSYKIQFNCNDGTPGPWACCVSLVALQLSVLFVFRFTRIECHEEKLGNKLEENTNICTI